MAFQRVESVADDGAAEQDDARRIGEAGDEATVERAGDEGDVLRVHAGGFEADGVVVSKAMDVIERIDDFARTARRAAGEDDVGNVALRDGNEIFIAFMDIMLGSQREVFQIIQRERPVWQMGEFVAIERRMEPAMLDMLVQEAFLLTANDVRRLIGKFIIQIEC